MEHLAKPYLEFMNAAEQALRTRPVDPSPVIKWSATIDSYLKGIRTSTAAVERAWKGSAADAYRAVTGRPSTVPAHQAAQVAKVIAEVNTAATTRYQNVVRIRREFESALNRVPLGTGPSATKSNWLAVRAVANTYVGLAYKEVQQYRHVAVTAAQKINTLAKNSPRVGPKPEQAPDTGVPRPAKPFWHPDEMSGKWRMESTPSDDRKGHALFGNLEFTRENGQLRIRGTIEASKYVDDGRVPSKVTVETYLISRDGTRTPIGFNGNVGGHVDSAGKPDGGGNAGFGSNPQYGPTTGAVSRHAVREEAWHYSQDISRLVELKGLDNPLNWHPEVASPTITSVVTWEYPADGNGPRLVNRQFDVPLQVPRGGLAGLLYNGPQPVRLR